MGTNQLLWDTPTSVFITSSTVFHCNFRIRLHNECMRPSVLRGDEDGISVCYPWTDLGEKWVLGGTSMVRLSWNLPIIQWCSSVGTFQWCYCISFLSLIHTFLSFLHQCGCSGITPNGATAFLIFKFNKVGMYSSSWFVPNWCLSWFMSSWCFLIERVINKIYNLYHHALG